MVFLFHSLCWLINLYGPHCTLGGTPRLEQGNGGGWPPGLLGSVPSSSAGEGGPVGWRRRPGSREEKPGVLILPDNTLSFHDWRINMHPKIHGSQQSKVSPAWLLRVKPCSGLGHSPAVSPQAPLRDNKPSDTKLLLLLVVGFSHPRSCQPGKFTPLPYGEQNHTPVSRASG